jgi:hypothetical protein
MEYWYALRMLGIDVRGPAMMFGDNISVVINCMPSSQLKKKHNAVAYH